MNFLEFYKTNYFSKCNPKSKKWIKHNGTPLMFQRGEGFYLLFKLLLKNEKPYYNFVETGVLRNFNNWFDGQSTFLFQEFLKFHSGKIHCVDISEESCEIARSFLDSNYVSIECDDSLNFLKKINLSSIDFFHLDSYDVDWSDDENSSDHHLKEFLIIEPHLKYKSIVMIDDNTFINGVRTGKGRKIYEYLKSKEKTPIYDKYQLIYQF